MPPARRPGLVAGSSSRPPPPHPPPVPFVGLARRPPPLAPLALLSQSRILRWTSLIAFLGALLLIPIVARLGARLTHAICLAASGIAMLLLPGADTPSALFVLMIGIGIGWAGMMGNTYVMLADCIPADRTGTYMGIFNMFIVIPMLIQSLTMPLIYRPLLGGDPRNVLLLGGVLMIMGAAATLFIKAGNRAPVERKSFGG